MPASQMCDNLIGAKMLAIPAPPKAQMAQANKYMSDKSLYCLVLGMFEYVFVW